MKNGTAKVPCTCKHEFQDATYGLGVRVANATAKQDQSFVEVRCAVCAKLHRVPASRVS